MKAHKFWKRFFLFILVLLLIAALPLGVLMKSDISIASYEKSLLNKDPSGCVDSDGDLEFNNQLVTQGFVTASIDEEVWTLSDVCTIENSFPSRMIRELRCAGDKATVIDITCPRFAPWCQDGRCVAELSAEDSLKLEVKE